MYSAQFKETVLISIFLIVVLASGADLVADLSHGAGVEHILKETLVVLLSVAGIGWLLWGLRQQRLEIRQLRGELESVSRLGTHPESYVIEGRKALGNVVSKQFSGWQLTDSEQEVGWLLLKGFSLKEIVAKKPADRRLGKVAIKYRNPKDPSQTWTGRGRKPKWLVAELEAGKSLEKFAI